MLSRTRWDPKWECSQTKLELSTWWVTGRILRSRATRATRTTGTELKWTPQRWEWCRINTSNSFLLITTSNELPLLNFIHLKCPRLPEPSNYLYAISVFVNFCPYSLPTRESSKCEFDIWVSKFIWVICVDIFPNRKLFLLPIASLLCTPKLVCAIKGLLFRGCFFFIPKVEATVM